MNTPNSVPYRIFVNEVVSKLVGVTFENRQDRIKRMSEGDVIQVTPKPHPKHKQAIMVYATDFSSGSLIDIGYLPKELANIVHQNFLDNGNPAFVEGAVTKITGGFAVDVATGIIIGFTMPSGRKNDDTSRR